jgi:hypothetical protein
MTTMQSSRIGGAFLVGSGRLYRADVATGIIADVADNDIRDLLNSGCWTVPTPPPSPAEGEPQRHSSESDARKFAEHYVESAAGRPSQRGLLRRRTDLGFPATDDQLLEIARNLGIRGGRGRSRKPK